MFNTTNLLDQVNEHKMEFLHNRILRESGKREEQYVSKLVVESLLDEEISELISFEEAVQNMMHKLTPVVEKALLVNPLGMEYPIIKEHVGYKKINIEDWIRTADANVGKSNNSEEIEEGVLDKQSKKIKETVKESTTIFSGYKDIEDKLMKSCNIKDVLSPYTTEEPKEIILGSVTDDIVKEAAEELSMTTSFINDAIDKAIKLKAHCYGSILDINNKIETINMNDNYTEEDVLNTEATKLECLEQCLNAVFKTSNAIKNTKKTFIENAKFIVSVANYNPRSFKESNSNIMNNLDTIEQVVECSLLTNVNNNKSLDEIEEGDALDKMKANLTLSNRRFLDKYSEAAKKSSCLGIVMKEWYIPKDIDKQFKRLSDEVNKKFGKDYKSIDALEADYKKLRGNILGLGGEYSNISKKQLGNKPIALVKDLACEKKSDYVIKKSDVVDAIKILKDVSREIDDINSKNIDVSLNIAYGNSQGITVGKTKEERLKAKIDGMRRDLMKYLQSNYYKIKLTQLKILQKQSRLVIMKAARQKPTNEEATIMTNLESCIDEIGEIIMR